MRAIVVKLLPSSEHKPARLKLTCKNFKPIVGSYWAPQFAWSWDFHTRARQLACARFIELKWCREQEDVSNGHELPNGDLVFVVV